MSLKNATEAQKRHMAKVRELGCVVCRNLGLGATPAQVHHLLKGGRRKGHYQTIPLCPLHHNSGINDIEHVSRHPWKREFERRYGTEQELLEQTLRELEQTQLVA